MDEGGALGLQADADPRPGQARTRQPDQTEVDRVVDAHDAADTPLFLEARQQLLECLRHGQAAQRAPDLASGCRGYGDDDIPRVIALCGRSTLA